MSDMNRNSPDMLHARDMVRISITLDEVRNFKAHATRHAPYSDRVGVGLASQLLELKKSGQDRHVLHEIDVLEGLASNSSTKRAAQFRRPPLHPLWHKHFFTPRHLISNIGIRWGIEKGGNRDLDIMIERVAREHGDQPDVWQNRIVNEFGGGFEDRARLARLTGDWIVFAVHAGRNYYLDVASHAEGRDDPERLLAKLRAGSAWEFPFIPSAA